MVERTEFKSYSVGYVFMFPFCLFLVLPIGTLTYFLSLKIFFRHSIVFFFSNLTVYNHVTLDSHLNVTRTNCVSVFLWYVYLNFLRNFIKEIVLVSYDTYYLK